MYLGSWALDDALTFTAATADPGTGAAADADSAPSYRVYEDETATPLLTGTMALLDGSNTVGLYSERITLSAANGFERGKCYTVYIEAAVGGVTGTAVRSFQMSAAADVRAWGGDPEAVAAAADGSLGLTRPVVYAYVTVDTLLDGAITAAKVAADAGVEIANAVLAAGDVDGFTLEQTLKLCLAALAGKLQGATGTTVTIRAADDSKDRIVATVDSGGNRTAVTLDATG